MELDSSVVSASKENDNVRLPYPAEAIKPVDILGVDERSYFHLSLCDDRTCAEYGKMVDQMKMHVRESQCLPNIYLEQPGFDCILEHEERRGQRFARAKIMFKVGLVEGRDDEFIVKCQLTDDVGTVELTSKKIFPTSVAIAKYLPFVIKCKLDAMEMFLGSDVLKEIFALFMEGALWPEDNRECGSGKFLAKFNRKPQSVFDDGIPVVQIYGRCTDEYSYLNDVLQQYLPTIRPVEFPKAGEVTSVKITDYDSLGTVWFQHAENDVLISLIEERLAMFHDGYLERSASPNQAPWKGFFCQERNENLLDTGSILRIFKDTVEQRCYRVRHLYPAVEGKVDGRWIALFVDYGYVRIISDVDRDTGSPLIIPCNEVDENLAFIGPQCLPAMFLGAHCEETVDSTGDYYVDCGRFWKYVGTEKSDNIVQIKLANMNGNRLDQNRIHDRMMFARNVDHGISYLPPPCIPEGRDRKLRIGNVIVEIPKPSFNRQQFNIDKKNTPVSLFLDEFIRELKEDGGRGYGRIILPRIDILLELKGKENEGIKSLYGIYHSLEFCSTHGPYMPIGWHRE